MTMNRQCQKFAKYLNEWLDESLAPKIKSELQEHLRTCDTCQQLLEDNKKLIHLLETLEPEPAPVELKQQIIDRATKLPPESFWEKVKGLFTIPTIRVGLEAAAVFALILIGWQIFYPQSLGLFQRPAYQTAMVSEKAKETAAALSESRDISEEKSEIKEGIEMGIATKPAATRAPIEVAQQRLEADEADYLAFAKKDKIEELKATPKLEALPEAEVRPAEIASGIPPAPIKLAFEYAPSKAGKLAGQPVVAKRRIAGEEVEHTQGLFFFGDSFTLQDYELVGQKIEPAVNKAKGKIISRQTIAPTDKTPPQLNLTVQLPGGNLPNLIEALKPDFHLISPESKELDLKQAERIQTPLTAELAIKFPEPSKPEPAEK